MSFIIIRTAKIIAIQACTLQRAVRAVIRLRKITPIERCPVAHRAVRSAAIPQAVRLLCQKSLSRLHNNNWIRERCISRKAKA